MDQADIEGQVRDSYYKIAAVKREFQLKKPPAQLEHGFSISSYVYGQSDSEKEAMEAAAAEKPRAKFNQPPLVRMKTNVSESKSSDVFNPQRVMINEDVVENYDQYGELK